MASETPTRDTIFCRAIDIASAEERAAFIAGACGDDPGLRRGVEKLVAAHFRAGSFLESHAPGTAATVDASPVAERPGTTIGPYKLLELIGEGGFGVVFLAEQQHPVRRKVALKVLKPGMDTRQVVARFEAERQALALMDHPHIAKVLDGGEMPAGRPYFVMELVKGVPVTDFCDQDRLPIRDRLGLFVDVCQAVRHAHQKGVIHRDLKPSNVLVTRHDDRAVVKVIDFGIAKAMGQQLTDKTVFTSLAQLIGTPLYMSPEQAGLSGLDVDTRSDVYSLGVLLYELLTGTTPFDREALGLPGSDEMRRVIRDVEPPAPSQRLNTLDARACSTVSGRRGVDGRRLGQVLRGELDWIVMKCLEKDRDRRYESASALADDVQRYLADEPVLACPPSAGYRLRKLARRQKRALLTLGLVMTALVGGTAASAWQALRATRAEGLARERLGEAEANLLLARRAVDEMYTQVSEDLEFQPHMQPFQRDVLVKALRFYQEFGRRRGGDPAARRETAVALLRVSNIECTLGQRRQAKADCEAALAALEGLAAELPAEPERRARLGHAYKLRGAILVMAYRPRLAEESYRQALALFGGLAAEFPGDPKHRRQLAATYEELGNVLSDRPREAEKAYREAVRLNEELLAGRRGEPGYQNLLASSYSALARFFARGGQPREAEGAFRQAIDLFDRAGHLPERTSWRCVRAAAEFELGNVLAGSGRQEAAEGAYGHALAEMERFIDAHPDLPSCRRTLASWSCTFAAFLRQRGRRDEAERHLSAARALYENDAVEFLDDDERLDYLISVSKILRDAGDLGAAGRFFGKAQTLAVKLADENADAPAYRQRVGVIHRGLGIVWQRRGRPREAAEEFRRALATHERLAAEFPEDSAHRHQQAEVLNYLGIALRGLPGEAAAALRCHEQAAALCDRLVADFPDQPYYRKELVRSQFARGAVLRQAGRPAEAARAFRQAVDASGPLIDPFDHHGNRGQFASVHNEWAWLLAAGPDVTLRDPGRAVELARKGVELEPGAGGFWDTLGVALYRAGDWNGAVAALEKSEKLAPGQLVAWNLFFLAMAHERLGEKERARKEYARAVQWMEKNRPRNEELRGFRAEAEELLQKR